MRLLVLLLGFLASSCFAGMDEFVNSYVADRVQKQGSAFVVSCSQGEIISTLLVPIGDQQGLLLETKAGVVVNLGEISLVGGNAVLGDTNGGIYSYDRVKKTVDALIHRSFSLISLESFKTTNQRPRDSCFQ